MPTSASYVLLPMVLVLGCQATTSPTLTEPSEPEGIEPVASRSLVRSEGQVGRAPDAPDRHEATLVLTGPLAKFVGEPLDVQVDPDGLTITDYALGEGPEAKPGDTVSFHYVGTLEDGSEFDSTHARNMPFAFELGAGRVIPGLERGMTGARPGMVRVLSIPPALGYGDRGAGNTIPSNATLMFYIEVLAVEPLSP